MVCKRSDQLSDFTRSLASCTHLGGHGVVPAQFPEGFRELHDPLLQLCILFLTSPDFERADVLGLPIQLEMPVSKKRQYLLIRLTSTSLPIKSIVCLLVADAEDALVACSTTAEKRAAEGEASSKVELLIKDQMVGRRET